VRRAWISVAIGVGLMLAGASSAAGQGETAHVLIFSGTTGYRHGGPGEAIQPDVVEAIQNQLAGAGITSDYRTCDGTGTAGGALPGCRNPTEGVPAIFTPENLAQYDAIFFWQASSQFRGQPQTGPLFNAAEQAAIEEFAHAGGGIAAMHASVTMGAGDVTWPWWDAPGDSAIGALMPGHSATDISNVATVQVSDRNHPSTSDLPDSYELGDEHYTFSTNVRGTHHVLMTLDEESYDLGSGVTSMGADHPIAWCRMYEGARVWASSLGHFAASYRENGFDNNLMKHLVGGVAWAAGTAGADSDCGGTVWSNFTRTTLATGLNGAIGLDIAPDGKVYWTEIGVQGINSQGQLRMYDPEGGSTSTLLTLETRADYQSSNAGVLGMALDPGFEQNRHLYVYYSPRVTAADSNCTPPQANCVADGSYLLGDNVVSRFTLNAAGTAVIEGSEQEILRVPSVKVGNDNSDGIAGKSTYSAHQGGGSLSFDSEGNLYLGTGDDVDPFMGQDHNYAPIDQRYPERYDARNTSANTNDLRGKILRIHPLPNASGEPGVGTTYSIPEGNMFAQGTPQTKPEIYAMGFRNPFTVQADPNDPGTVVVGEYGPDAATDSPAFGPAGVIEWNHISEPGFFGWPLCVGDNAPARSYFRYTFPSGPQGTRYDCSASAIPNESEHNTGLNEIPGPAVEADVWAKNGGGTPPRFGIPGVANETATGPIYDYDPANPSPTKWPAYYDGAWLIFNRASNWWREVRPLDDRSGILRVNGFFQANQFGAPPHNFVIPTRFGPDGSLYLVTWSGGCCRSGLPGIGVGTLMRIDFTGEGEDTTPPQVDAELSGNQQGGVYVDQATLTITATDASGVDTIEYRVNAGEWAAYEGPVEFTEPGSYDVDYRATDLAPTPNTSEPQTISFEVIEGTGCVPVRSDEFDGTSLDTARWSFLHPTTPATGPGSPSVSAGVLNLPLGSFSVDLARPGPIGYLGQPLPEADFTLTAEVFAPGLDADTAGQGSQYAQTGLKVFQTDDDWIKIAHTRNNDGNPPGSVNTYLEMTYEDAGTRTLGDRSTMVPPPAPVVWFRIVRSGSQLSADYSLTDPEQGGIWTPLTFGGGSVSAVDLSTVFAPADGPVYIGLYGGNGSVTAGFDYVRFEPDEPGDCDPPTTTVQLNGADPVASYDGPVEVKLEATDGAGGSGVASTEYALDGGSLQEYTGPFTVAEPGSHEIEFFSSDNAGNVEETQSVSFEIEEGGAPDLRLAVRPKRESAKVGKVARFTATARNLGDTAAGAVRLCAKGPRSKVKVKGKACTTRASLAPGAAFAPTFKLAPKRAARGQQVRITFTASSPGAGTERATATLAVRRR
jgi:glucose/arabinose dehydrogenase/type 1 glutamine amidotransferase